MKHKHYDMIVAKAANMELVVFYKLPCEEWWQPESDHATLPDDIDFDYFLCLPQHKEACLHWLNGGKSQAEYTKSSYPYWCDIDSDEANWSDGHIFMDKNLNIRIKQKKEKRLIVYRNDTVYGPYLSIDDINTDFVLTGQVVEIEVEV